MTSKIRVLHILNHSYPYTDGYALRSYHMINGQRRHGLEPKVLTSPKHEPSYARNPEIFQNTRYYRTPNQTGNSNSAILGNLGIVYSLLHQIRKIHYHDTFDLIHAHSPSLCGLAALLSATVRPFITI